LRELAVTSQKFAGEFEPPTEIEYAQSVDEQGIVLVGGAPST